MSGGWRIRSERRLWLLGEANDGFEKVSQKGSWRALRDLKKPYNMTMI
jgi:predicted RNA binding protein YcfA (HicA-like mRNA interferase family)